MSDLANPMFTDEAKAREWLEARIWPNGPICPHCGVVNCATLMRGKSHRPGLYQCNACREPFSVTVGTLYERSKIPLHKWLAATHLMMASKKGMSALQIGRMLGLSKKTAWFLNHRIRESLRETNPDLLAAKAKSSRLMKRSLAARKRTSTRKSVSILELAASARKPCLRLSNAAAKFVRITSRPSQPPIFAPSFKLKSMVPLTS
jgi:transposase-like protein